MTRRRFRVIALLLSAFLLGLACDRWDGNRCDEESEWIGGLEVIGFSLGTNGKGYLTAIVRFGDECSGGSEHGRLFAVDVNARTAVSIPVDSWPGTVWTRPDGASAAFMAYRDEDGLVSGIAGLMLVEGLETRRVPLPGAVWELQPSPTGWIAATESSGTWEVDAEGTATQLDPGFSRCGDDAQSGWVVCSETSVVVLSSSRAIVGQIPFPERPSYVAGNQQLALVVLGTSVGLVQDAALLDEIPILPLGPHPRAWITSDSRHAIASGWVSSTFRIGTPAPSSAYQIRLADRAVSDLPNTVTDVAYLGTNAYLALGRKSLGTAAGAFLRLGLETGTVSEFGSPTGGRYDQIEVLGERLVFAKSAPANDFWPGDSATIFVFHDANTGAATDTWTVTVE